MGAGDCVHGELYPMATPALIPVSVRRVQCILYSEQLVITLCRKNEGLSVSLVNRGYVVAKLWMTSMGKFRWDY